MIREAVKNDIDGLMYLYKQLHDTHVYEQPPHTDERIMSVWERICGDSGYHMIVAEEDGKIVSTCTCIIIPNLTREQRPYAFVENVVTDSEYRGRGLVTACLDFARDIAVHEGCYKMMLLTGSKEEKTLKFYENAGYSRHTKTAFQQELK